LDSFFSGHVFPKISNMSSTIKILIVCSGNKGRISPFIHEQGESLKLKGHIVDYFQIVGRGIFGYLNNYFPLLKKINSFKPDLIHAHYCLSGLLANLQRTTPVIVTYHGSDVHFKMNRLISRITAYLAACNIFVSNHMARFIGIKNSNVIPCGVDLDLFKPCSKLEARINLGLEKDKVYVLFSSSFNNKVKNSRLALSAMEHFKDENLVLIELKEYSRNEVALLMNAVDFTLLTSFSEGSPQFIKEAMACNCPVISTRVGDVVNLIGDIDGCFLTGFNTDDLIDKIRKVLLYVKKNNRTEARKRIIDLKLDNENVASKIVDIYKSVAKKRLDN
jgi:teichuronic acid biosynthesis glycosyltransferase TuaC